MLHVGAGAASPTWAGLGGLDAALHRAPLAISLWVRSAGVFRIADANAACTEFWGLTREQLIGASVEQLGGDRARATRDMLRAASGDRAVVRELPYVMPSGELRDLKVVYFAVGPEEVLVFIIDLTSQRTTEERLRATEGKMQVEQAELRESRQRFAQVFEEAPVGMVFIGAGHLIRGRFLGANAAFRELLGYREDELLDLDMLSVTHPDDVERERVLTQELFENERSEYSLDKRFIRADGSVVWARFRAHVLRDDRGAPLYGLGLAADITAEQAAQVAMADAVARATALLDLTPDAVVEVDDHACVTQVNGSALLMLGFEQREIAGKPFADLLVPDRLRARFAQALASWVESPTDRTPIEPTDTTLVRADGSAFPAELRISALHTGDGPRLLLYLRNRALQERAEAARRGAEERFDRLFRDGPVAAVVIDLQGRLADVNPAFCTLAARERASLLGRDAAAILAEAGDAADAPWRSGADCSGPLAAARRLMRPGGQAVPVDVTASLVRDASGAASQWICQCTPRLLPGVDAIPDGEPLSYRERQVLSLLAQGHAGPAIAERLNLSSETVRSYAQSAREKLRAKTRTEAVALALVRGDISL